MKCLRVPAVEIGRKGSRYYDTLTLQMAIKFMASLGGPEVVYVPGCRSIYHAQKSPTELDLEQIRSRMGQVINELVSQHVPLTTKNTREISRAVGEAARRMIDQIHEEMERLDAKAEFDEQLIQQQRNVGEPIPEGPDPDPVASPSGGEADIL